MSALPPATLSKTPAAIPAVAPAASSSAPLSGPPSAPPGAPDPEAETPADKRFEIELEFLQCLASPTYLNFLAQNQYLDDPAFQRYLSYLMYWTEPAYAKFVTFPHGLYFLSLLQRDQFRTALKSPDYTLLLHQQQGFLWQFSATPGVFRERKPGEAPPEMPIPGQEALEQQGPSASTSLGAPSPSPGINTPASAHGRAG